MKFERTGTIDELMNSVTGDDVQWEKVGRDFFSQDYDASQVGTFFSYLLDQRFYEQICIIMMCSSITTKPLTHDYLTGKKASSAHASYFEKFIGMVTQAGLTLNELMPFFVASFSSPKNSRLGKWNQAIQDYMVGEAEKDFEQVLDLLSVYDLKYTAYEPLVKADKDRAIDILINRLLFSKHINKTAIRKFLINHKIEVSENLEVYKNSNVKVREAIVRLLLLFKHDNNAAGFLDSISETETSPSVLKLVHKDFLPLSSDTYPKSNPKTSPKTGSKKGTKKANVDPLKQFNDYMVQGTEWGVAEFEREILGDQLKSIIASTLFFSVYGGSVLTDIVVVEQGKICDLDNNEIVLDPGKRIRVLHPSEIPYKYEFIKRLDIQQGIEQLRRKYYTPNLDERNSGISRRLSGTMIRVKELKKNMRLLDFKLVNKSVDGMYSGAGVRLGDYFCTVNFPYVDFDDVEDYSITVGEIKFYRFADLINISGSLFTENVPLCPVYAIEARIFSELMYSVYRLCSINSI